MTPEIVRRLSSGRWFLPILAAMAEENGSRFGALARRLQVSRSILSRSLDLLAQCGWIRRNPGHGHPLRPEYFLTAEGAPIAAWCQRVLSERNRLGLEPAAFGRWSLPLLSELVPQEKRFSTLQRELLPITPRALALTLQRMQHSALIVRRPVEPLYGLTDRGRSLASVIIAA